MVQQHTRLRRYETRLGEKAAVPAAGYSFEQSLEVAKAKFVIVGVPEDIGVLANMGTAGTSTGFWPFVEAFCNLQSNDFFDGDAVMLGGWFDFDMLRKTIDQNAVSAEEKLDAYRHAVITIDTAVEEVVKQIVRHDKIPIVIGGGHNNAYPIIKGTSKSLHRRGRLDLAQMNVVNLDAHADYRTTEGRHSGNGFRYAEEDGYLLKYCVLGLQEQALVQNMWLDLVNNPFFDCITWEDIYLHEKKNFRQSVLHALAFTEDNPVGLELDLDSVAGALASAENASGIPIADARLYVHLCAQIAKPAYLHICEGALQMEDGRRSHTMGKLMATLVIDFMKAHLS